MGARRGRTSAGPVHWLNVGRDSWSVMVTVKVHMSDHGSWTCRQSWKDMTRNSPCGESRSRNGWCKQAPWLWTRWFSMITSTRKGVFRHNQYLIWIESNQVGASPFCHIQRSPQSNIKKFCALCKSRTTNHTKHAILWTFAQDVSLD